MFLGIVGSDPYLAPEVYEVSKYDPRPTDVWSLAIIYACMSLRRFPWKAPRLTDNSYKLFVSTPTPGTSVSETGLSRSLEGKSKSEVENTPILNESQKSSAPSSGLPSRQHSEEGPTKHHHQHHHHHHHEKPEETDPKSTNVYASTTGTPGTRADTPTTKQEIIKGPWRLLRLLPRESRGVISHMLDTQPSRRATLQDMMKDPWVSGTPVCSQIDGVRVIRAPGHEHTLEPGSTPTPAPSHK